MTNACPSDDFLSRYVSGEADPGERASVEGHAASCADCRSTLAAVGLAFEPGSPQEEALVAWVSSTRPVEALLADLGVAARTSSEVARSPVRKPLWDRRGMRWAGASLVAAMAASLTLVLAPTAPAPSGVLPQRALQGRPALLQGHAPFVATRGGVDDVIWEAHEVEHARTGEDAAVAVLLARGGPGDWQRAERHLASAGVTAVRENDRGVLLLARGDAQAALAAFERALALEADLAAGLFNRALALEALGQTEEARVAWETYLQRAGARDQRGWVDEARSRLGR